MRSATVPATDLTTKARIRETAMRLFAEHGVPADELMGRRMETGLLAVLAGLRAKANWHRIMREWVYADPPSTVLGEAEWRYFERRGTAQTPGLPSRVGLSSTARAIDRMGQPVSVCQ